MPDDTIYADSMARIQAFKIPDQEDNLTAHIGAAFAALCMGEMYARGALVVRGHDTKSGKLDYRFSQVKTDPKNWWKVKESTEYLNTQLAAKWPPEDILLDVVLCFMQHYKCPAWQAAEAKQKLLVLVPELLKQFKREL